MRFGLRSGRDVICEKPLVLNPWNIDGLLEMEKHTGHNVNTFELIIGREMQVNLLWA